MKNFVQQGQTLTLAPGADVAAGTGYLFGTGLFGVALTNATSGQPSAFLTEGVVEPAKTSAMAIAVGDLVYWDAAGKAVNKTAAGQKCVGVAVAAAANPSATVQVKLGVFVGAGA